MNTQHILTRKPDSILIRSSRCAVPVNCFYASNNQGVWLIRIPQHRVFYLGGVLQNGQFQLLRTGSADVLTRITDSMPVLFSEADRKRWLNTGSRLMDVMPLMDRCADFWFDYYQIEDKFLTSSSLSGKDLEPIGQSLTERNEKLRLTDQERLRQARTSRGK
jgi:putative SOS response-associated peptidase YedK